MFQDSKINPLVKNVHSRVDFNRQKSISYLAFSVFSLASFFFFTFSVLFACMFITGLPQYPVPEAEDADHTEGEEDSGQTGSKEADTH